MERTKIYKPEFTVCPLCGSKLKYRYTKTKQDLKDLEEVTDATLHSQYDALAKGTQQGISTMPRLKNAMLEEAELLTTDEYRQKLALVLYSSIMNYFNSEEE